MEGYLSTPRKGPSVKTFSNIVYSSEHQTVVHPMCNVELPNAKTSIDAIS
jgi:hypothetical protein